ncbi:AAA family ATPase [Saccharopolyspora mangrovi]|uniref:AAA family ATPase n=1 Tax=Saccharopolyspora mangrovi TaxID=3082379 RepID=A0ABU6AKT9_9PSEU|nr:AAA family ATPase [Saccharopolyspora sp. S2-29]MEB3371925.1 AAA family ATPase [Saccharopolyspora sp. S2-29]
MVAEALSAPRDQRASETAVSMAEAGLCVFPVDYLSKLPACPYDCVVNPRTGKRENCGRLHASTGRDVVRKMFEHFGDAEINFGIDLRRSRLVVCDADTPGQVESFYDHLKQVSGVDAEALRSLCLPTVLTPGLESGRHKDGGHWYYVLPDGYELPSSIDNTAVYLPLDGRRPEKGQPDHRAVLMYGDFYVVAPPSVRQEGSYELRSAVRVAPHWVTHAIERTYQAKRERNERTKERAALSEGRGLSAVKAWASNTRWDELMKPEGWSPREDLESCGCPTWMRPGDDLTADKSAVGHESGCEFKPDTDGWVHFWSATAEAWYGCNDLSKMDFYMASKELDRDNPVHVQLAKSELGITETYGLLSPEGKALGEAAGAEVLAVTDNPGSVAAADGVGTERRNGRRTVSLTSAAEIKIRPVHWTWAGRLAAGTLGLIGGREGVGKSTWSYQFAADLTRGRVEGVHCGVPKSVIIVATEDSWEHTIAPRLMAAEADLERVFRADVTTKEGLRCALSLPDDIRGVCDAVREVDAALILLDPLLSRVDPGLDTHKDADVRRALEPLVEMADECGAAVLGLIHLNKSTKVDVVTSMMASRAFAAVARSVFAVIKDPDDESVRLLGQPKNNLGRDAQPTLKFKIESTQVAMTEEGPVLTGQLQWLDEIESRSIDEVMREAASQDEDGRNRTVEAAEWLEDFLHSVGGSAASSDVKQAGDAEGHSMSTLQRARKRIKVTSESVGFPSRSYWSLPGTKPQVEPSCSKS